MKRLLLAVLFTIIMLTGLATATACADYSGIFEEHEDKLRQERTEKLEAYVAQHPGAASLIDRFEASYYVDLSNYEFVMSPHLNDESPLVELYRNNRLEPARSIPVYGVPFERYEEGGNTFLDLLKKLEKESFAANLPAIGLYEISITNDQGQSVGTAMGEPPIPDSNTMAVYPWDGSYIDTYTLKLSAALLQALTETPLDLPNTKVHLVSFAGHQGAVFYDAKQAYFTPVMGEGWTSDCGLFVDTLYPVVEAISVFEKAFES